MQGSQRLQQMKTVLALAALCCFLWGSATPAIKIGYQLFSIDSADTSSIIVFAGTRFLLAGILVVLFQSGKSAGLSGAIGGVADSFLAKNKAKTWDAKLARATKWIGAVFLILTMILLILQGRTA